MSKKVEKKEVIIDPNKLIMDTSYLEDPSINELLDPITGYFRRLQEETDRRSSTPIDLWGNEDFDDPDDISP